MLLNIHGNEQRLEAVPRGGGRWRMPAVRRAFGGLFVSALLARAGFATETAELSRDLTTLSLEELAQTKVTSVSKTEEPRFRTAAAIQVLTAEDIRRSGAVNLPEALRQVPGV